MTWKQRFGTASVWAVTYCVSLEVWRFILTP